LGTGEHISDFEEFEARSFVSKLMGMGGIHKVLNLMRGTMEGRDGREGLRREIGRERE
jgi:signal recognition particle subunit SRP54